MKARPIALILLLALPALAFPQYKPWYNFYNFAYGAKARAMGNAFTAVADDLTAAFWNPAGLAALRSPEFYLSYMASSQKHDYDLQDRVLPIDTRLFSYNFDSRLNQIDFFSVSAPATILKRPWTIALSYYRYIPYGFKGAANEVLTYLKDRFSPQKTTVTFAGSEGLDVLAFSLSAAVTDYVSLGGTLQQFFGSGSMHLATVTPSREFHGQVTDKLQGRNVIVGALFAPFSAVRLGFTWHSGLKNRFDSTLLSWEVDKAGRQVNQLEKGCQARVVIPEQYSLGALLRPARWLDLSGEYSRLDWDKGTIENYYDAGTVLPFPLKDAWAERQKSVRDLRFGAEARCSFRSWQLRLRGGWSLERQLYGDVRERPVEVNGYAGGIACDFSPNLLVEVAYQRQVADWPEKGFTSQSPDVATHLHGNVFILSLTYRFGHIFEE